MAAETLQTLKQELADIDISTLQNLNKFLRDVFDERLPKPLLLKLCQTETRRQELLRSITEITQQKIYKEYLNSIIKQRLNLGFDLVHQEIESAPLCEVNQQITKITACGKCNNTCGKNDWCYLCFKNGKKHFLGYPVFDLEDADLEDAEFVF